MIPRFRDLRAGRDFLASGTGILLLGVMLAVMAQWYVRPPAAPPPTPSPRTVTYMVRRPSEASPAFLRFSLPSKVGFSRTVQPGDPKVPTTLGPRAPDIRFLPREPAKEPLFPYSEKPGVAEFCPGPGESPVFRTPEPAGMAWTVVAESLNGPGLVLPEQFQEAALWPSAGPWTAVMRLEAGEDGRVRHAFLMPPAPEPAIAAKLEALMRKARIEGERECRVKISRVEVPAPATGGAKL